MTLSLCICTMNRPDELRVALQSIADGSEFPHQVIVSDDGDGSSRAIAEEFPGVLYQNGPRRGLGANRNACVAAATGDSIAFIDDDVKVSHGFVARASLPLPTMGIVTGWELNHSTDPAHKVTPHNPSFLGFQREDPKDSFRSIVINATVFPSELFAVALFDEQIKYGYEEIDIARHATSLGYEISYDDELHVEHFPSPVNRGLYASELNVSRLYITYKAYYRYDRKPLKAALFNLVAGVHHMLHAIKNRQSLRAAVATVQRARRKQKLGSALSVG